MSDRLIVYFKPQNGEYDLESLCDVAEKEIADLHPRNDEDIVILEKWCSYISIPCFDFQTDYVELFIWAHHSIIAESKECREYVKRICSAYGASEWWYCSEMRCDYLYDLVDETLLEKAFTDKTIELEEYLSPDFQWRNGTFFIHDSIKKDIQY